MGALREILARFDVDVDPGKKLPAADSAISKLTASLRNVGAMVTGAAIVGGIRNFVGGLADTADQIIDTSAQLGISTQEYQRWALAAKLSGAEASDLATAIKILQKNSAEAAANGAKTGGAFADLGVKLRNADGSARSTGDVMRDVGVAIAKLPEPAQRTSKALEVFGKAGTKLLPMFAQGEEGIAALLAELDKLGGGFSKEALEKMGELGDMTDRYNASLDALKGRIAISILPTFTKVIETAGQMAGAFSQSANASNRVKAAVVLLGAAGAAAGVSMLTPWLPFIALMAGAYLVIDDLLTALDGGDAVITRVIDSLFGEGTGEGIFALAREDLEELGREMDKQPGLWAKVETAGRSAGRGIANFFKKDVPEALNLAIFGKLDDGWAGLMVSMGTAFGKFEAKVKNMIENVFPGFKAGIAEIKGMLGLDSENEAIAQLGTARRVVDAAIQAKGVAEAAATMQRLNAAAGVVPITPGVAQGRSFRDLQAARNTNTVQQANNITINVESEEVAESISGLMAGATRRGAEAALRKTAPE